MLVAIGMSQALILICGRVTPDMTDTQVRAEAQELWSRSLGANEHNRIYYMGLSCRDNLTRES